MACNTETIRTWAEVDLEAIRHNCAEAARLAGDAAPMPVIKANAYGHGDIEVARALPQAKYFAVATAEEALRLRQAGILTPVLVLGMVPAPAVPELTAAGAAVCCGSPECAREYSAAMYKGWPVYTLPVHLKIDTGMARGGVKPADAMQLAELIESLPGIRLAGVFTHFVIADEVSGDNFTQQAHAAFAGAAQALCNKWPGLLVHAANSGAIMRHPATAHDLVRPGIMLYGYAPAPDCAGAADLRPALSWYARIVQVRTVKAGQTVGYGRVWRAERDSRIATVAVGYADGLHRAGSGAHHMLVHGQKAPQVGRVCMDMCMLDVTDIPGTQAGDIATLLGTNGRERLTADDMAAACGTISYEVLCAISPRVPRLYKEAP